MELHDKEKMKPKGPDHNDQRTPRYDSRKRPNQQ